MSAISQRRHTPCRFTFADGRRCRMLLSPSHTHLCTFHARKESQAIASQRVGRSLAASLSHDFITACDLTAAMSQLFAAIAQGHLKHKTANTLAYVGQTMAQTLRLSQQEFISAYGAQAWRAAIRDAVTTAHSHNSSPDHSEELITPADSTLICVLCQMPAKTQITLILIVLVNTKWLHRILVPVLDERQRARYW
jgi:hypothetical protein